MEYTIIKNAGPVPPMTRGNKEFKPKYPFYLLDVGDAFDVPGEGEPNEKGNYKNWNSSSSAAAQYGRKEGKKFVGRRVSDNVFRYWRIA